MKKLLQNMGIWLGLIGVLIGYYALFSYLGVSTSRVYSYIFFLMPIWLPITSFFLFYKYWMEFVQFQFARRSPRVTLEFFLPQEIFKSPVAMELILNQLYQTATPDNLVQAYWDGKNPPVFSLEFASTEGQVRMFITTQARFRNLIEAQFYAQYPGIEIKMLDIDYTAEIPERGKGYESFAIHYKLKKPDPYPIRTYIDYDLHTNPKEEVKVDPISVTLESLGALGPGEHMWLQIIIRANKGYSFKTGSLFKQDDWKGDAKKEIESIMERARERGGDENRQVQLTEGERDTIKAIERNVSKYAFNAYVRAIYMGKEGKFDGTRIGMMIPIFRSTDDVMRNSIGFFWRTETDWPWWQDIGGSRSKRWKAEEIEYYKSRYYYERNSGDSGMIFSTEELATLWHLPGSVVLSPNVQRIGSQRAQAPSNLPI